MGEVVNHRWVDSWCGSMASVGVDADLGTESFPFVGSGGEHMKVELEQCSALSSWIDPIPVRSAEGCRVKDAG